MKTAISNIAWKEEHDEVVLDLIAKSSLDGIEIAPTRLFEKPLEVEDSQVSDMRARLTREGKEVVAAQALLYGQPDLKIFESVNVRKKTLDYLEDVMAFCGKLGRCRLVFGSPKNRARGAMSFAEARTIAIEFFREAGRRAEQNGTVLVLEPNPEVYSCDFITNGLDGIELVEAVDHPGFRLHLDAAGMTLANDDVADVIRRAKDILSHFHASEPNLGPIGEGGVNHALCASTLREIGYSGHVSVEMRHAADRDTPAEIERAISFVATTYGDES